MRLQEARKQLEALVAASALALLAVVGGASGAARPPAQADAARDARQYEIEQLRPLFDKAYEAGADYYKNGWRSEALWCFERATLLLPEAGNLTRFTELLRDYDNPVWRKKRWKSPRAAVEAGFKRRQEQYDAAFVERLLKIGAHHGKDDGPAAAQRARESYRTALAVAGGPYDVDGEGRVVVGKAGAIPLDASKELLATELVVINGKRWLRDSMLRSLPETAEVFEARSERALVRTTSTLAKATALLALIEQAVPVYQRQLGERKTARPLGLFVFADAAAYQAWCKASGHADQERAAGFANSGEGFAVAFEGQPALDKTAVHEAAHLWHFDVYDSALPSWYAEGVACWFGHDRSMTVVDGKLTTGIAPTKAVLAPLVAGGKLALPLDDLLHGDAGKRIAANDGSAANFYLASWALYCFLTTTKEPRLATRFDEWESFALGSRGGTREDAAALFDRLFADSRDALESGFASWLADPK